MKSMKEIRAKQGKQFAEKAELAVLFYGLAYKTSLHQLDMKNIVIPYSRKF